MKISLKEIEDILAGMTETVYLEGYRTPESMLPIIQEQLNYISSLPSNEKIAHDTSLKQTLLYFLNNKDWFDYNRFLHDEIYRGFSNCENAYRLFVLIWDAFFAGENWKDESFHDIEVEVYDGMNRRAQLPRLNS